MKNLVQIKSKSFPIDLILKGKTKSTKSNVFNINFADLMGVNELIQNKNTPTNLLSGLLTKNTTNDVANSNISKFQLTKSIKVKNNFIKTLPEAIKQRKSSEKGDDKKINTILVQNTNTAKSSSIKNITENKDTSQLGITETKIADSQKSFVVNAEQSGSRNENLYFRLKSKDVKSQPQKVLEINSKNKAVKVARNNVKLTNQFHKNENSTKKIYQVQSNQSQQKTPSVINNNLNQNEKIMAKALDNLFSSNKKTQSKTSDIQSSNTNVSKQVDNIEKTNYLKSDNIIKSKMIENNNSTKSVVEGSKNETTSVEIKTTEKANQPAVDSNLSSNPEKTVLQSTLNTAINSKTNEQNGKHKKTVNKSPKVLLNKKGGNNESLENITRKSTPSKIAIENSVDRNIGNQISEKTFQTSVKDDENTPELKKDNKASNSENPLAQNNQSNVKTIQIEKSDMVNFRNNIATNSNPIFTSTASSVINTFFSNTQSILNQVVQLFEVTKNQNLNMSKFQIDLGQNEKFEIQFTKQGNYHSARIFVGSEVALISMEKIIPELKMQLENRGINFISLDVEMENFTNDNQKNENLGMANKNQNYGTKYNNSDKQIIDQISAIRDFGYNTIEILA